jgi:ABC-type sugar transport system ATPase subunit
VTAEAAQTDGQQMLLECVDIRKSYGATQALKGVNFTVRAGEVHGLCGQNGAGKSTLVKIVTGLIKPDSGKIKLAGNEVVLRSPSDAQANGIAVVDQELSVIPALTVAENIMLGSRENPFWQRKRATHERVQSMLDRLGLRDVSPESRVETLPIATRQLIEIARLLERNAKVLVLDEPTASLSRADSLVVFTALRELASHGHGIIYVSHRLDEILDLCTTITVIRDGSRVGYHRIADVDHGSLVRMIVGEDGTLALRESEIPPVSLLGDVEDAAQVNNVSMPDRLNGISFSVRQGEVLALAGQVGSGSTEVLRALAGLEPTAETDVRVAGAAVRLGSPAEAMAVGLHFVSNDRKGEGLFLTRSVATNLIATRLPSLSRLGVVSIRRARETAAHLYRKVQVRGGKLNTDVAELSGGNQQKVFIGRCLDRQPCRLLLLDEPTRGVDVGGRAEIHKLIREACAGGASAIFASGDPSEVLTLADRVITLNAGQIVGAHPAGELTESQLLAEMTSAGGQTEGGSVASQARGN